MREPLVLKSKLITCPHAFSTRVGGVSTGLYESLNLSCNQPGDEPELVRENWRLFGQAAGIDTSRFVHAKQVHENYVHIARPEDACGILDHGGLQADGHITDIPGLPLAVFTADCTPLLLHEPVRGIAAAIHCGWRSTMADIEGEAMKKLTAMGGEAKNVRAAIGPCIRSCCFQVGPEVAQAAQALLGEEASQAFYRPDPSADGKLLLDLAGVVRCRLLQLGVPAEQIEIIGECTMCHPERYWSHRRTGLARGSQASIIML